MNFLRSAFVCLLAVLVSQVAVASEFPQRLIRIVGSGGPGSALDLYGRAYADAMRQAWNQPVIFDPKGAATGMVATREVAKAPPDGHVILLTSINHVLNPIVRGGAGYEAIADFEPVALVVKHPLILIANSSVQTKSVKEFVDAVKRRPDELVYASPGVGSINHLTMEAMKSRAGLQVRHIPFSSSPSALNAVLAGEVPYMYSNLVTALPHIQAGKVQAIAVSSASRLPILPQVPTLSESIPDLVLESWYAVLAPAGTPRHVVDKLGTVIRQVSERQEFRSQVAATGGQSQFIGPEEFRKFLASQQMIWSQVVRDANIPKD